MHMNIIENYYDQATYKAKHNNTTNTFYQWFIVHDVSFI